MDPRADYLSPLISSAFVRLSIFHFKKEGKEKREREYRFEQNNVQHPSPRPQKKKATKIPFCRVFQKLLQWTAWFFGLCFVLFLK